MTRRPRGTGRVRSEPRPGWGTVAPQKSPSLPFRSLCPTPISTVTYLAGTKCSQGSRDTGRFRIGRPVPAPRRVLRDLEPRPGAGWAAPVCHSVQEAQDSLAALPPQPGDPGPARARVGLRDCGREPNPAVPRLGCRRGGVATWRGEASGASGAQRCSRPVSTVSSVLGRPGPSPEFPLRGRQG